MKRRISSDEYKKALEHIFTKHLGAKHVELDYYKPYRASFSAFKVNVLWVNGCKQTNLLMETHSTKEFARLRESTKYFCQGPYGDPFCYIVYANSLSHLARKLIAGAKIGKKFGFYQHVLFSKNDSIDAALIELDL